MIGNTPIGVTLTYQPVGAFLPVDLEFPWATPDDMVFVLAAFKARQGRGQTARPQVHSMFEEARESQTAWHACRVRHAIVQGLGRWAWLMPSKVIDRIVNLAMRQYHESIGQWEMEIADLYAQVSGLNAQVGALGRAQVGREARPYGPQILCAAKDCGAGIPLARPLTLPSGWSMDERGNPCCPQHPVFDVKTSTVAS